MSVDEVYVLKYEDWRIVGIFDDEAKAKEYLRRALETGTVERDAGIDVFPLNPEHAPQLLYVGRVRQDGTLNEAPISLGCG